MTEHASLRPLVSQKPSAKVVPASAWVPLNPALNRTRRGRERRAAGINDLAALFGRKLFRRDKYERRGTALYSRGASSCKRLKTSGLLLPDPRSSLYLDRLVREGKSVGDKRLQRNKVVLIKRGRSGQGEIFARNGAFLGIVLKPNNRISLAS